MKITDVRLGMLRVPLKTPFKTALRTVDAVEDIVVSVHTDTGHVGYGEAAATAVITGDTHGSIIEVINKLIAPRLVGMEVAELNAILQLIHGSAERNTSAKAAVEIAVYDLWAQLYGAPLYRMLGGGDPAITTDITISVDYIDKMVADSLSAVDRGFESLKIKVGKEIGVDLERVKAIYAAVEGRALLRLDANQGWTAKQAVYAIRTLEDAGVQLELVEQQQLLGQSSLPGELSQPRSDRVHLVDTDRTDLAHVDLIGGEAPLGVEREPDVRLRQQLLVPLRLGEEVGAPRLQVEHHVHTSPPGGVDPRAQIGDLRLGRVVAVWSRGGRRHRGDDLERRHDRLGGEAVVARGHLLGAGHSCIGVLLAEDAQHRRAGVAVEGDHPARGEQHLAATG